MAEVPANILSMIAGQGRAPIGPDWNAINQNQEMAIKIQKAQEAQQGQNALKWVYSDPNNYDPQTMQPKPEAWSNLMRMSPAAGMDLRNNLVTLSEKQARTANLQTEGMQGWIKQGMEVGKGALDEYHAALEQGVPAPEAMQRGQQKYTKDLDTLKSSGMPESLKQRLEPMFDPIRIGKNQATWAQQMAMENLKKEGYQKITQTDPVSGQPQDVWAAPGKPTLNMGGQPITPSGIPARSEATLPKLYVGTVDGKTNVPVQRRVTDGAWETADGKHTPVEVTDPHTIGTERQTGQYGKVAQIAIEDPDNPSDTKIVPAQQDQKTGQWVTADANREPLPTPKRIVSTGGSGRQAEAQAMAMINAGNEAAASLKNLVELPVTATSGWFKGLTSDKPESIAAAVGRSIAGYVNERDARSLQISWQGIGRSMATLEAAGRATGLVGLQKQAESLQPQKGDTYTNVLRSYAEIRQIVERSIETMKSSPGVSSDQKKLLDKIAKEAETTVPWTVHDVNQLETGGKDSVLEFAKKVKVGAAGEEKAPSVPTPAASPMGTAPYIEPPAKGGPQQGAPPPVYTPNTPHAMPTPKTPAEAQKLPPGTHYMTPDGHEIIR